MGLFWGPISLLPTRRACSPMSGPLAEQCGVAAFIGNTQWFPPQGSRKWTASLWSPARGTPCPASPPPPPPRPFLFRRPVVGGHICTPSLRLGPGRTPAGGVLPAFLCLRFPLRSPRLPSDISFGSARARPLPAASLLFAETASSETALCRHRCDRPCPGGAAAQRLVNASAIKQLPRLRRCAGICHVALVFNPRGGGFSPPFCGPSGEGKRSSFPVSRSRCAVGQGCRPVLCHAFGSGHHVSPAVRRASPTNPPKLHPCLAAPLLLPSLQALLCLEPRGFAPHTLHGVHSHYRRPRWLGLPGAARLAAQAAPCPHACQSPPWHHTPLPETLACRHSAP